MSKRALFALLVTAGVLAPVAAAGQGPVQLAMADPKPHFVAAWAPKKEREAEHSAVLARRVSLELTDVSLDAALKALTNQAGLRITYSRSVLPAGKRVTINARDIAVVTALTEILFRSGLDVVVDRDGAMALMVCRHPAPRQETQDSGAIVGRVTDKATGVALAGAAIAVEGGRWSATTDADGRYRMGGVEAGTYMVRARYIGYAPLSATVTVTAGTEATVDLGLVKSVQKLDELVTVTPGGIQTQVKALPTPVTVITADDIERQRPATLNALFRQAVPSGVSFDIPGSPILTSFSTRGASSLSGSGLGLMKVFVDGVEVSDFGASPVDPISIERIEVVRGPQAATVYGADAAGGVVQITTKRGDPSLTRPQVEVEALGGAVQTPYDGVGSAFRQQYSASVRGGGQDVSYNLGAGYTRLADWQPNGEISRQSRPSVYGTMHYARGIVAADLHARYLRNNVPIVLNPELQAVGIPSFSRPFLTPGSVTNETYGARVSVAPTSWWRNQLTLGTDRSQSDSRQARRRFTTPDDTLFQVTASDRRKISLFFNSSLTARLGSGISGSLTAGIDHYRADATSSSTSQALNTEGAIETDPPGAFTVNRATVTNTGYFAQAETSWKETLFLTAGLRADQNSTFGTDLSTAVSPRIGLSAVRQIGQVTIKMRGAFGRAIRAPEPGAAFGATGSVPVVLPNPLLGPERQRGWDGGVDLVFGDRGSLSVTGYTQTAEDLIAGLQVPNDTVFTFQNQNVGRVTNRGIEIEGALSVGPAQFQGQYGYVRSRIEDLGPAVSSDAQVQIGDTPVGLPNHTAGASLTVTPAEGTTLSAGVTYVGSFRRFSALALFRCFGGTGPCQPAQRDYVTEAPGFAKVSLAVTQQITRQWEAVVAVENLTNNFAFEGPDFIAVTGRTTMVGVRARF